MRRKVKLTGEDDVKDAGVPLPADLVGRRAHQRAVVLVVKRRVRQLAPEEKLITINQRVYICKWVERANGLTSRSHLHYHREVQTSSDICNPL